MSDLSAAEQAAAEALAERHNAHSDTDRLSTAAFAGEARAVVEAVRPIIEADALEALAGGADKYGPIGAAHLRAGAFVVRKGRTIRDCLSDDPGRQSGEGQH